MKWMAVCADSKPFGERNLVLRWQALRTETRAMMTSNQLTQEQRLAARLFDRAIFAEGHGYGQRA
jgi:hypothetical protein